MLVFALFSFFPGALQTRNIGFCGSSLVEGNARGVVIATGNQTVMGSLATAISTAGARPANLQLEVRRIITILAILAGVTSIVLVFSWVFWLRVQKPGFISLPGVRVASFVSDAFSNMSI